MHACSWLDASFRTSTRSPSTAARPRRSSGRRKNVRSFACSPWKRVLDTIESLSMRSRLSEDRTS